MTDREILELARIGKLAVAENDARRVRDALRKEFRSFLRDLCPEPRDYIDEENDEPEIVDEMVRLRDAKRKAQQKLDTARAATRRAIVRAAAEIGKEVGA